MCTLPEMHYLCSLYHSTYIFILYHNVLHVTARAERYGITVLRYDPLHTNTPCIVLLL